MLEHQGIFLPDTERHFVEWMTKNGEIVDGRGTYQIKKIRAALSYCSRFRAAVDIGGHVGLWSMHIAKKFAKVYAFEPLVAHMECFSKNLSAPEYGHVELIGCALGREPGMAPMASAIGSGGDTSISALDGLPVAALDNGNYVKYGMIPVKTLDSFDLKEIDFIKVDCEGYELFALQGGEQTILRDRPVIIVEQKPGKAQKYGLPQTGAVTYLEGLGYSVEREMSGDFIMTSQE